MGRKGGRKTYNKQAVDKATRQIITGYMRKYDEWRRWCETERERARFRYARAIDRQEADERRASEFAARMEAIDSDPKTKIVQALEQARQEIVEKETRMREQRENLRLCVWLSCKEPRKHTFEKMQARFFLPVSERSFYRHKNQFFAAVKKYMEL